MKADRPQKHKGLAIFSGIYRRTAASISMLDWPRRAGESMRTRFRQFSGLDGDHRDRPAHRALGRAVAPLAARGCRPFSVICHSGGTLAADQATGQRPACAGHACDHCNLVQCRRPPFTCHIVVTSVSIPRGYCSCCARPMSRGMANYADPKLPEVLRLSPDASRLPRPTDPSSRYWRFPCSRLHGPWPCSPSA